MRVLFRPDHRITKEAKITRRSRATTKIAKAARHVSFHLVLIAKKIITHTTSVGGDQT